MARRPPFAACIFDLDGVLADSMRQHHLAYVHVLEPLGVQVTREDVYAREGMNSRNVARELLANHRIPVDDEEARRLGERKQAAFRAFGRPPLHRGADALVGMLRNAGMRTAVVTGTSRENARFILGPLAAQFDAIVADGDYQKQKPDPEPFLAGALALKVDPSQCAAVENAPLGIRSAVAAGMTCIAVPTTMPVEVLRESGAHAIAGSLAEVGAMVLQGQGFKRS